MRLVFAGTPPAAVPSLEALLATGHDVAAVLTRPDARSGRGRGLAPSAVKQVALARGIEVLTPPGPRDPGFLTRLREIGPDVCPVVAYGAILPPSALGVPRLGWVNLHFSLLPAWRGAAPVQHAVMAGDEVTGASTFRIEQGMDTGPVYGVMTERIRADDTAGALLERLAEAGAALLVATLDGIEKGRLTPVPQPEDGVSFAPKLAAEDARIDWDAPAFAVDRQVRGCTPAPGAWTTFRGERIGVGPVRPTDPASLQGEVALGPGEVHAARRSVRVGTGTGTVQLGRVRPHARRQMAATDWARGARIGERERFDG